MNTAIVLESIPAGFFDNNTLVLSANPTAVNLEPLDAGSLLDRARSGDAEAYCDLCRMYETRLLRQALSLCGNPSLAEDLAQDTLVEAWKSLRRYSARCQFFTWLCAILLNRYRNTLRQHSFVPSAVGHAAGREELEAGVAHLADRDPLPDEAVSRSEQAELVHRCIQLLPQKHKEVIYLRFYVDNSLEGIAAALGCSIGTVKSRLFHALEKLRSMKALQAQPDQTIL